MTDDWISLAASEIEGIETAEIGLTPFTITFDRSRVFRTFLRWFDDELAGYNESGDRIPEAIHRKAVVEHARAAFDRFIQAYPATVLRFGLKMLVTVSACQTLDSFRLAGLKIDGETVKYNHPKKATLRTAVEARFQAELHDFVGMETTPGEKRRIFDWNSPSNTDRVQQWVKLVSRYEAFWRHEKGKRFENEGLGN